MMAGIQTDYFREHEFFNANFQFIEVFFKKTRDSLTLSSAYSCSLTVTDM